MRRTEGGPGRPSQLVRRRSRSGSGSPDSACGRQGTARYDFEGCSSPQGYASIPTNRAPTWFARCTSAGWRRECGASRRRPSCPITSEHPTRSRSERRPRHPPTGLCGPPSGHRDRAARVPHAVVARHVRARAVEAIRDLPRRPARGAAGGLPGLLAIRHRLARDERGGGRPAPATGHRQRTARPPVRAGRQAKRAVHARGAHLQRRRHPPLRGVRLPDIGPAARVLPRQPRGRPDHVAHGAGARDRVILALETSCDDTCAAVVTHEGEIRSNVIASQGLLHARYGGVVPEIASRHHLELVDAVTADALERAHVRLDDVDTVAVTQGPGLIGALLVGLSSAKALAASRRLPLTPVDHLHGHVVASTLGGDPIEAPYMCLVASGGHTFLARVDEPSGYDVLGQTLDDAAGEAFDKGARLLGLGYPGGPAIDRLARKGDPAAFDFPRSAPGELDFSFSGLKTSLLYAIRDLGG